MCRYVSAIWNPDTHEVAVAALYSHHRTYRLTGLNEDRWHEMHYLPSGDVECRHPLYTTVGAAMAAHVQERWPTFSDFEVWATQQSARYYDENGYDAYGYDEDGYDEDGYDEDGYDVNGYDRDGYDAYGYNKYGYDEDGYDEDGYDVNGYDEDGYDEDGYDRDGAGCR